MNKYLHHYTDLGALEAILKNKTIRFTTLSKADDPDEGQSADLTNIGRFVFVSCWTEADEKYTMWDSRYANNLKGVRISLPRYPFVRYKVESGVTKNGYGFVADGNSYYSFLPNQLNSPSDYVIATFDESNILIPVEYTDDHSLLTPNVFEYSEEILDENGKRNTTQNNSIKIGKIGRYKSLVWEDQREIRYRFYVLPCTYIEMEGADHDKIIELYKRLIDPAVSLPFEHIDLRIDNLFFDQMIVTTGPKISNEDYKKVMQLISEFNPKAQIVKSKVKVR